MPQSTDMYKLCLFQFARQFYIAQWYRDCNVEVEKLSNSTPTKSPRAAAHKKKKRHRRDDSEEEAEEEDEDEEEDDNVTSEVDKAKEVQQMAEVRKAFLLTQIQTRIGMFASFK